MSELTIDAAACPKCGGPMTLNQKCTCDQEVASNDLGDAPAARPAKGRRGRDAGTLTGNASSDDALEASVASATRSHKAGPDEARQHGLKAVGHAAAGEPAKAEKAHLAAAAAHEAAAAELDQQYDQPAAKSHMRMAERHRKAAAAHAVLVPQRAAAAPAGDREPVAAENMAWPPSLVEALRRNESGRGRGDTSIPVPPSPFAVDELYGSPPPTTDGTAAAEALADENRRRLGLTGGEPIENTRGTTLDALLASGHVRPHQASIHLPAPVYLGAAGGPEGRAGLTANRDSDAPVEVDFEWPARGIAPAPVPLVNKAPAADDGRAALPVPPSLVEALRQDATTRNRRAPAPAPSGWAGEVEIVFDPSDPRLALG